MAAALVVATAVAEARPTPASPLPWPMQRADLVDLRVVLEDRVESAAQRVCRLIDAPGEAMRRMFALLLPSLPVLIRCAPRRPRAP